MKKVINNWNKATQNLADHFVAKYYGKECVPCSFWVGDEIGDIFCINDDFYNIDRIKQAIDLGATYEQLREFAEYDMEVEKPDINFKNYLKLGAIWKK